MRTWSVSGTAFALCTRSSSLSIKTSTSMDLRSLQRSAFLPEPAPLALRLGLRLGLGLRFRFRLRLRSGRVLGWRVRAEDPAAAAGTQLVQHLLCLVARQDDLV